MHTWHACSYIFIVSYIKVVKVVKVVKVNSLELVHELCNYMHTYIHTARQDYTHTTCTPCGTNF